jgi:xanthine dehydrogenase accessory factor
MKEIRAIINAYEKMDREHTGAALATVVRVEGSSYRRTGARMLVMDDGVWVGGISGGCLEGDALKRARLAIAKSESSLITYDTTEDDAYQIGVGLGCNGIIEVLFTPIDFSNKNNPVEVLKSCVDSIRQTHLLITIISLSGKWALVKPGDIMAYRDIASLDIFEDANIASQLQAKIEWHAQESISGPQEFQSSEGKKLVVFIEVLLPEIQLVLMGHQYDVYPLSMLAKVLGWRVIMVTNPLKVNSNLFSGIDQILESDQFAEIPIDQYTAILLMSHDFKTDKLNLTNVLRTEVSYIGMLGPKVRAEKIFRELAEEGKSVSAENLERIHAPAGLDIGALSPEEIALSLTAEIRSVFSKREGGFLKLRQSTIHERA